MGRTKGLPGLVGPKVAVLVERFGTKLVADAQKVIGRNPVMGPLVDRLAVLEAKCSPELFDSSEQFDGLGFRYHG